MLHRPRRVLWAFGVPRPVAPDLTLRTFDIPATRATDVKLVVLSTQCTGYAGYAGEQDNDPTNATDCTTASTQSQNVRAAELEVLSSPVSVSSATGPAAAAAGEPAAAQRASSGVLGVSTTRGRSVVGLGTIRGIGRAAKATFRVNVAGTTSLLTWKQNRFAFQAVRLASMRIAGSSVTLGGTGLVNGRQVPFEAVFTDKGAKGDVARLVVQGVSRGGRLTAGGFSVR